MIYYSFLVLSFEYISNYSIHFISIFINLFGLSCLRKDYLLTFDHEWWHCKLLIYMMPRRVLHTSLIPDEWSPLIKPIYYQASNMLSWVILKWVTFFIYSYTYAHFLYFKTVSASMWSLLILIFAWFVD